MSRTVIVGGPKTGKTTLANGLGKPVVHTDEMIGAGDFSAQSEMASQQLGRGWRMGDGGCHGGTCAAEVAEGELHRKAM